MKGRWLLFADGRFDPVGANYDAPAEPHDHAASLEVAERVRHFRPRRSDKVGQVFKAWRDP
jgi:hypothetical protein